MANKRQRKKNQMNAGQSNIRITQKDNDLFQRLTRNAKAKIKRVQKNYGIDLSKEVDLKKMDEMKSRKEFNLWVERLQSFTNRHNLNYQYVKNDNGLVLNKKVLNQVKRANKKNQQEAKAKKKEIENLDFIKNSKRQKAIRERMIILGEENVTGISIPADFDFNQFKTPRSLDRAIKNIMKRNDPKYYNRKNEILQDNFIRSLEGTFNTLADDLVNRLREINPDDFYELYLMFNDDVMDFTLYDSEGQYVEADEGKVRKLESIVDEYESGKLNMDLKDFPNR